jgi:hypothetical protein
MEYARTAHNRRLFTLEEGCAYETTSGDSHSENSAIMKHYNVQRLSDAQVQHKAERLFVKLILFQERRSTAIRANTALRVIKTQHSVAGGT